MVKIDGEDRPVSGMTLKDFLVVEGYESGRLAVERNGEIVPQARYGKTVLEAGIPWKLCALREDADVDIPNGEQMRATLGCGSFVKVEIMRDTRYLLQDNRKPYAPRKFSPGRVSWSCPTCIPN